MPRTAGSDRTHPAASLATPDGGTHWRAAPNLPLAPAAQRTGDRATDARHDNETGAQARHPQMGAATRTVVALHGQAPVQSAAGVCHRGQTNGPLGLKRNANTEEEKESERKQAVCTLKVLERWSARHGGGGGPHRPRIFCLKAHHRLGCGAL